MLGTWILELRASLHTSQLPWMRLVPGAGLNLLCCNLDAFSRLNPSMWRFSFLSFVYATT